MADSWFRFYNSAVHDPKVQRIPAEIFRFWINVLCLASSHGGHLPSVDDMQFTLRMKPDKLSANIGKLVALGLLDQEGQTLSPHNWDARQFKSDGSTERVKRFRSKERNVSETLHETGPDTEQRQSRTETENKKAPSALFVLPDFIPSGAWEDFLEMRKKAKKPATEKAKALLARSLEKLMIEGHDPASILEQSTLNNWTDVYPIKEKLNGHGKRPTPHEVFARAALAVSKE